jgi:hypothetical protein
VFWSYVVVTESQKEWILAKVNVAFGIILLGVAGLAALVHINRKFKVVSVE